MTGHLVLHIGPPKTATTALQCALQAMDRPDVLYLGTHQPRGSAGRSVSNVLHDACLGQLPVDSPEVQDARETISKALSAGRTAILSEELFLVWQDEASFFEKLERLERLLAELPRSYVIVLRAPGDALPSYYQELYDGLPPSERDDADGFFRHARCDCYDYYALLDWFASRRLVARTIPFDRLISGRIDLADVTGPGTSGALTLEPVNAGARTGAAGARQFPARSLSHALSRAPLVAIVRRLRRFAPRTTARLNALADRVILRPPEGRLVVPPHDRVASLSKSYRSALLRDVAEATGEAAE